MDEGIELRELFKILFKYRVMIALLLIASVATAAFVSYSLITPIYQAETTILINTKDSFETMFSSTFAGMGKNEVGNYIEIFKSRSVMERVIKDLGFDEIPDAPGIEALRGSISIQPVTGTDVVKVKVESSSPERARDIANTLVNIFIEESQLVNQAEARGAREFIEEQLVKVERELAEAEKELLDYKKVNSVTSPSDEGKALLQRLSELDSMKAGAQIALSEAQTRLENIYQELEGQADFVESAQTLADNPFVKDYKARLADLEIQLAGLLQNYTEKHPTVIRVMAEIDEVKNRLALEEEKVVASQTLTTNPVRLTLIQNAVSLRAEISALEIKVQVLADEVKRVENELSKFPQKELELMRLLREQSVSEEIYLMLMTKREEMKITEAMKVADIRLIDFAITPTNPIKPKKLLNVAISAFLAFFVGCGLAFFFEYVDTTIKTQEDVEGYLGLPVLGTIPSMSDKTMSRRKRKRKMRNEISIDPGL
jgi:succinoglycan biosynthesis transport protein ExoP